MSVSDGWLREFGAKGIGPKSQSSLRPTGQSINAIDNEPSRLRPKIGCVACLKLGEAALGAANKRPSLRTSRGGLRPARTLDRWRLPGGIGGANRPVCDEWPSGHRGDATGTRGRNIAGAFLGRGGAMVWGDCAVAWQKSNFIAQHVAFSTGSTPAGARTGFRQFARQLAADFSRGLGGFRGSGRRFVFVQVRSGPALARSLAR